MDYCILGTAGHIDHGKTALIKTLSGMDTDRLKEEKERGISIDLGFAYLDLDNGLRCGIIDVPGHERFIKNMVAGSVGIDIVILVVAANEGVMPQTVEHMDILRFLGIKQGIIVITKTDLATDGQIEKTRKEIKTLTAGTFLEEAPVICFSAANKAGSDDIKETIKKLYKNIGERDKSLPLLLPVDRVFTISGFGTVITGTIQKGHLKIGDTLEVLPAGKEVRVRNIQVHNEFAKEAWAGQRAAINLTGINKGDLKRGIWLASKKAFYPTKLISIYFTLLPGYEKSIKSRFRVRLHLGTNEIIGRIYFLEKQTILPGESQMAQLILEKEVIPSYGDLLVIRSYSPIATIGGGKILKGDNRKHKKNDTAVLENLYKLNKGKEDDRLEQEILQSPLSHYSKIKEKGEEDNLKKLIYSGKILNIQNYLIHIKDLEELEKEILLRLENFHEKNPLRTGPTSLEIKKEITLSKYKKLLITKVFKEILDNLVKKGKIEKQKNRFKTKNFQIKLNRKQENLKELIYSEFNKNLFKPPSLKQIKEKFGSRPELKEVMAYLIEQDIIVPIEDNIFHIKAINKAQTIIIDKLKTQEKITAAEARDALGTSRKYAIAILEYFDEKKITKRVGDTRILIRWE